MKRFFYTSFAIGLGLALGACSGNDDYETGRTVPEPVEPEPVAEVTTIDELVGTSFARHVICSDEYTHNGNEWIYSACAKDNLSYGDNSPLMEVRDMEGDGDQDIIILTDHGTLLLLENLAADQIPKTPAEAPTIPTNP
ncbi:hypothetical protein HOD38_00225 [archaeon]|jgi:hypothetical protein|nr:hypothetical protein [archaeon]MBT4396672.1 hypothetical protein [archaeon]MBT4441282.1 hypothetical protein [archaeon]